MGLLSKLGDVVKNTGATLLGSALNTATGGVAGPLLNVLGAEFGVDVTGDQEGDSANIAAAIQRDPEAAVKLRQIEAEQKIRLREIALEEAKTASLERQTQVAEVNRTMRAEAQSESWMQRSWRPFNGFLFGITLFCVYFGLPLLEKELPEIPEWVWMAWASVLGVAAWHRGQEKRVRAGEQKGGGIIDRVMGGRG